jgi:hypothetical protein
MGVLEEESIILKMLTTPGRQYYLKILLFLGDTLRFAVHFLRVIFSTLYVDKRSLNNRTLQVKARTFSFVIWEVLVALLFESCLGRENSSIQVCFDTCCGRVVIFLLGMIILIGKHQFTVSSIDDGGGSDHHSSHSTRRIAPNSALRKSGLNSDVILSLVENAEKIIADISKDNSNPEEKRQKDELSARSDVTRVLSEIIFSFF